MSLDFRNKKPVDAPGAGEPLLRGKLPLPEAMASRSPDFKDARLLTPLEREELEKAGVNLAAPIPGNVADLMAEFRREQGSLQQAVDAQVEANRAASQAFIPTGSGVAQAREVALQAASHRVESTADPAIAFASPRPETEPEPTEIEAAPRGAASELTTPDPSGPCPRCLHDPAQKIEEPDKNDVIAYLPVLRGGRFRKTYSRFGGRVQIRFRTLETAEYDMIQAQLIRDVARGVVTNELSYGERLYEYRMTASLESLVTDGGVPTEIPPLARIPWDSDDKERGDEANVVGALWKHVRTRVLTSETLMRTCATAFAEFVKIRETLDLRAASPDFWTGIGS